MLILNKNDPPYIISDDCNIGIEVTRLTYEEDEELKNVFEKYNGFHKKDIQQKILNKFVNRKKHNQFIVFDEEDRLAGIVSTAYNNREQKYLLLDIVCKKIEKLNSNYYLKCKQNYLFINNSGRFFLKMI